MASFLDENGLLYVWQKIKNLLSGKVDVVAGKSLSTNDFTDALKTKLEGISSGANAYTLPTASSTTKGGVKVGSGLIIEDEKLKVDLANQNFTVTPYASKVEVWYSEPLDTDELVEDAVLMTLPVATTSVAGAMSAADKSKLDGFSSAGNYALKSDITSMYRHKGSVASVSSLPSSGQTAGDVYNVTATGMNYVWTGSEWDALGEVFSITAITNTEIDTICA